MEVRWYQGNLVAKVTALSIPPLAKFISDESDDRNSYKRRRNAVVAQGFYCEAQVRTDEDTCVMEWPAVEWLLDQRNRTTIAGATHVSACVPSTQFDASDLWHWRQWARQVRLISKAVLGTEKRELDAVQKRTVCPQVPFVHTASSLGYTGGAVRTVIPPAPVDATYQIGGARRKQSARGNSGARKRTSDDSNRKEYAQKKAKRWVEEEVAPETIAAEMEEVMTEFHHEGMQFVSDSIERQVNTPERVLAASFVTGTTGEGRSRMRNGASSCGIWLVAAQLTASHRLRSDRVQNHRRDRCGSGGQR